MEIAGEVIVEGRLVSGERLATFTISLSAPISQVREEFAKHRGVPPLALKLFLGAGLLQDTELLQDYCEMMAGGRIVLMLAITQSLCRQFDDACLTPSLDEALLVQRTTVEEAKDIAASIPGCKGFCFNSDGASSSPQEESLVEVFFCARVQLVFRRWWRSYILSDPSQQTQWKSARDVRKGSYMMIQGRPAKVLAVSNCRLGAKGGGPQRTRAHFSAVDLFTARRLEDFGSIVRFVEVPSVERKEFTLVSLDPCSGQVTLLASGETRTDLKLAEFAEVCDPTAKNHMMIAELIDAHERGENVKIVVVAACGMEQICAYEILARSGTETTHAFE